MSTSYKLLDRCPGHSSLTLDEQSLEIDLVSEFNEGTTLVSELTLSELKQLSLKLVEIIQYFEPDFNPQPPL